MAIASNTTNEVVTRELRIIEGMPGFAWSADTAGRFTYVSSNALVFLGSPRDGLNSSEGEDEFGWRRFIHPDDYQRVASRWRQCLETGDHYDTEHRLLRADGVYRWFRNSGKPSRDSEGRITEWHGTTIDIDDQKQTEAALREREAELSQLIDMVPSHLWRLTPDGEPTFFNKRMVDFIGLGVADTIKPGMTQLNTLIEASIHQDDAPAFRAALDRSLVSGERFSMRYRLRRTDGVYHWMSSRAEPVRDKDGRIIQWFGLCHDIDDQVHAEQALRESEHSLRRLIETLPGLIYCAAPDGKPIYRSKNLREFLGFNLEDKDERGKPRLAGTLEAIIHPDDLGTVKERYAHSLSTGEAYALRHRLRRFDGEYRWVETRATAMRDGDGAIAQWNGICLDIEDQIRAQEKLLLAQESLARASKAASLAELSASIAHEVNQPLAAVAANSYACQRWLEADPPNIERARKTVERITRDANAAAEVVSRIRALFKQSVTTGNNAAIGDVIGEVCDLMGEEAIRRRVRMVVDVESDLPLVALDRIQIQQVLINLARNGMEAMETTSYERILTMRVRRADDMVQVEIGDRGAGIEFPEMIFEPFYTTKEHGMGMGLAICRSFIETHGGRLWVQKNEPRGSTFIFTLPFGVTSMP